MSSPYIYFGLGGRGGDILCSCPKTIPETFDTRRCAHSACRRAVSRCIIFKHVELVCYRHQPTCTCVVPSRLGVAKDARKLYQAIEAAVSPCAKTDTRQASVQRFWTIAVDIVNCFGLESKTQDLNHQQEAVRVNNTQPCSSRSNIAYKQRYSISSSRSLGTNSGRCYLILHCCSIIFSI